MNNQNMEHKQTEPNAMPLTDSEEQMYAVNVDGETIELTLEQLIAAAEQGLSKMNLTAQQEELPAGQPQDSAYGRFAGAYPDMKPTDIPEEVWQEAERTGDLLGAYRLYEIRQLRQELEDLKTNQKNRALDVGSARSDGQSRITDPIILALMGKG